MQTIPNEDIASELGEHEPEVEGSTQSTQGKEDSSLADPSSVAAKIGVTIARKQIPIGLKYLWKALTGKRLLMVGPSTAGKTCFSNYLLDGVLTKATPHETTPANEDISNGVFEFVTGRDDNIKLIIKQINDTAGQVDPKVQAEWLTLYKPHCLILIIDTSMDASINEAWIKQFSEGIRKIDKRKIRSLKVVGVALNKIDAKKKNQSTQTVKKLSDIVKQNLYPVLPDKVLKPIPIRPTISILTPNGSELIDEFLRILIKQFFRKRKSKK